MKNRENVLNSLDHIYVQMFGPTPAKPTGLAAAVFRRARVFAKYGIRTTILVDHFAPDADRHQWEMKVRGFADDDISVRNMYLELAYQIDGKDPKEIREREYVSPLNGNEWTYEQDPKREEVWRGRHNGAYKEFVWTRDSGSRVHFIDYLNNGKRTRRVWFNDVGLPVKTEHMNPLNKPERIDYISPEGAVYLIELPNSDSNGSHFILNIGSERTEFSSKKDLYEFWLTSRVFKKKRRMTIISEYGLHEAALARLEKSKLANVVFTLHSNHLSSPYSYGRPIRPDMSSYLERIYRSSPMVVLTDEQALDLQKALGLKSDLYVVPHHVSPYEGDEKRDAQRVVLVGRFAEGKGHREAILAFRQVLKVHPGAKLSFYGRGETEKAVSGLIEELGLQESISVEGFSTNPMSVFASATVSIVASTHEGFCLSLLESMAAGCVPVSYSIKYGPKELITNGTDGLLVEPHNINELGAALTYLLNTQSAVMDMSKAAKAKSKTFSEERLWENWAYVLSDIHVKKRRRGRKQ